MAGFFIPLLKKKQFYMANFMILLYLYFVKLVLLRKYWSGL